MPSLSIFYPTWTATVEHSKEPICTPPANRFFNYIRVPSLVKVIHTLQHTAIIQFPWRKETDIVSLDYLHSTDSPKIKRIVKLLKKEQQKNE